MLNYFNYSFETDYCGLSLTEKRSATMTWLNHDLEERFQETIKSTEIKTIYDENSFAYTHNAQGFRCDDFTEISPDKPCVVFLGCSMTYGIGLPIEHTWSHIVWRKLVKKFGRFPYINISRGGISSDFLVRMLYNFSRSYSANLVVGAFPPIERAELVIGESNPEPVFPNVFEELDTLSEYQNAVRLAYIQNMMIDEGFNRYRLNKNLAFLDSICRGMGAEQLYNIWSYGGEHIYYEQTVEPPFLKNFCTEAWFGPPLFDKQSGRMLVARDGAHPPKEAQEYYSEIIYPYIERLLEKSLSSK